MKLAREVEAEGKSGEVAERDPLPGLHERIQLKGCPQSVMRGCRGWLAIPRTVRTVPGAGQRRRRALDTV